MIEVLGGIVAILGIIAVAIVVASIPALLVTAAVYYLAPVVLGMPLQITFLRLFLGMLLCALVFRFFRGGSRAQKSVE